MQGYSISEFQPRADHTASIASGLVSNADGSKLKSPASVFCKNCSKSKLSSKSGLLRSLLNGKGYES